MQKKLVNYALLYTESNPPLDIFEFVNRYDRQAPTHRAMLFINEDKEPQSHLFKVDQKVNYYSFSGTLPLQVFIQLKRKVEADYPNMDVHLIRNDETPIDFKLMNTHDEPLPAELVLALGTFFNDSQRTENALSNEAEGKIPGTVYERVLRKIQSDYPHIRLTKYI